MGQIKDRKEIASIRTACAVTDEIFAGIVADFHFATERELAAHIRREIRERGLRPAFPPIVTGGARAGNSIHPKPTSEALEGFVILDFGVRIDGYCSDMTRTVFVATPTREDRDWYALVARAKRAGERAARPGASCAAADSAARESMGERKRYFIHTLGHGVGKRIHERPRIYFKSTEDTFAENMVVTIEPGIYLPDRLGIRIEDTYLVGPKGLEPLTRSPQKLLVFPKRK